MAALSAEVGIIAPVLEAHAAYSENKFSRATPLLRLDRGEALQSRASRFFGKGTAWFVEDLT